MTIDQLFNTIELKDMSGIPPSTAESKVPVAPHRSEFGEVLNKKDGWDYKLRTCGGAGRDGSWQNVCLAWDPLYTIKSSAEMTLLPFEKLEMKSLNSDELECGYEFPDFVLANYVDAQIAKGVKSVSVVSVGCGGAFYEMKIQKYLDKKFPGVANIILVDPLSYDYLGSITRPCRRPDYSYVRDLVFRRPDLVGNCVVFMHNASPSNTYEIDALNRLDPKLVLRNATNSSPDGYYCGGVLNSLFNNFSMVGLFDPRILDKETPFIHTEQNGMTPVVRTQSIPRRSYRLVHEFSHISLVGTKSRETTMWQFLVPTEHPKTKWCEKDKTLTFQVEHLSEIWDQAYNKWKPIVDSEEEENSDKESLSDDGYTEGRFSGNPEKAPLVTIVVYTDSNILTEKRKERSKKA